MDLGMLTFNLCGPRWRQMNWQAQETEAEQLHLECHEKRKEISVFSFSLWFTRLHINHLAYYYLYHMKMSTPVSIKAESKLQQLCLCDVMGNRFRMSCTTWAGGRRQRIRERMGEPDKNIIKKWQFWHELRWEFSQGPGMSSHWVDCGKMCWKYFISYLTFMSLWEAM